MADEEQLNEEVVDTTIPEMWALAKPPVALDDEEATEEQKKKAAAASGGPKVGKLVKYLNDIEEQEEFETKIQERDPATNQSLLTWATLTGKFVLVEWLLKKGKRSAFAFTNANKEISVFEKMLEVRKEIEDREREKLLNPPEEPEEGEDDEEKPPELTFDQQVFEALSEFHEEWADKGPHFVKSICELGVYQGHRDAQGTKVGLGQTLFPDGDMYTGEYKDNQRHGVGTYYWSQHGMLYCGEWRSNKRHGVGRMVFPDGARYFGAWSSDKICGAGRYTYPDGSNYNGTWIDGVKHGEGVYTFTDGSRYVGTFVDGNFVAGEWLVGASGTRYVGRFENGAPVGKGIFVFKARGGGTFRQEGEYVKGQWVPGALCTKDALPSVELVIQRKAITISFGPECAALPAEDLIRAINFGPFRRWLQAVEENTAYFVNSILVNGIRTRAGDSRQIEELRLKLGVVDARGRRVKGTETVVLREGQTALLLILTDGAQSLAIVEQTLNAAAQSTEQLKLPLVQVTSSGAIGGHFLNVATPALRVAVTRATTMLLPFKVSQDVSQGNSQVEVLAYIQKVHPDTISTAQARLDDVQRQDPNGFSRIRAVRLEDVGAMSTDAVSIVAANYIHVLAQAGQLPAATAEPQRPPTPIPPGIEERPDIEPLLAAERAKNKPKDEDADE